MRLPLLLAALLLLTTGCSDDEPTPTTARPTPTAQSTAGEARPVRLTGDGVDLPGRVAVFGDGFEPVRQALTAALGRPSLDTGEQSSFGSYGTCPGSRLRALEFGGGALRVLFGDVDGPVLTMYQWSLIADGRPADVPRASALVGDTATFEFGVGTAVGQLRSGSAGAALDIRPGDEMLPASFRLSDQSAGFFGRLTGTADSDTVTGVLAGTACGE